MQMYVNYFDRRVKTAAENSTVGIVLCKHKNKALVEITLPKGANIHAREYQLYHPAMTSAIKLLESWLGNGTPKKIVKLGAPILPRHTKSITSTSAALDPEQDPQRRMETEALAMTDAFHRLVALGAL